MQEPKGMGCGTLSRNAEEASVARTARGRKKVGDTVRVEGRASSLKAILAMVRNFGFNSEVRWVGMGGF